MLYFRPHALAILFVLPLVAVPVSGGADSASAPFAGQFNLSQDPESVLREVLSRSEFDVPSEETRWDRIKKTIDEIIETIIAWLLEKLKGIDPEGFDPNPFWRVGEGLLIGAAILLAFILADIVYRSVRARRGDRYGAIPSAHRVPLYLSSRQLRDMARESAENGDYRMGLILLFRAVVLGLEEEGKIAHHGGKTNWEIVRSISGDGLVRESVRQLVPIFNRVFYGEVPCGREDYERFRRLCGRVTEGI